MRCRCPHCQATYRVPDGSEGKRIKCPKCAAVFAAAAIAEAPPAVPLAVPTRAAAPVAVPASPAIGVQIATGSTSSGAYRAAPKKKSQSLPLILAGGVLVAAIAAGGAYVALNPSSSPKKTTAAKADAKPVAKPAEKPQDKSPPAVAANPAPAAVTPVAKPAANPPADPPTKPLTKPAVTENTPTPFALPKERVVPKPFSLNRPNKPQPIATVTETAPNVSQAFFDNPTQAAAKYGAPQVLQIEGAFVKYHPDPGRGGGWLRLQGSGNAMVDCFLEKHWTDYAQQLQPGDMVQVVGGNLYPRQGSRMLVNFDYCEFVGAEHRGQAPSAETTVADASDEDLAMPKDKDGRPLFTLYQDSKPEFDVTAEQLARELIADPGSLYQKYKSNAMVRVTGVVHEIKEEERIVPVLVIYLKGQDDVLVEMEMNADWKEFVKRYKPGDKVVMHGLSPARNFDKPKIVFVDAAEFPR